MPNAAPYIRYTICLLMGVHAAMGLPAREPGDLLRQGIALTRALRPLEAETVLDSITERDPDYPAAQTLLGYLLLRRGAPTEAETAFTKVLALEAGSASARLGLGTALVQQGRLESGAREFAGILDDPELGVRARVQWILSLFWMGKESAAFNEARDQAARFPSVADYQRVAGFFFHLRGQVKEARQAYRRALEIEPYHLETLFSLISICRAQRDWNAALQLLEQARRLDVNHPLVYGEMAFVYEQLGRAEEAQAAAREARSTFDAERLYTRAVRSGISGHRGEAESLLRECLRTNPRLAKAWTDLGEMLRRDNRLEEARTAFQAALDTEPGNQIARLGMAATLQEQTGTLPPQDLAEAALPGRDREEDAEAALLRAVESFPDNPDLYCHLGYLYESGGNSRESLEAYSQALRLNPLQIPAMLGKARQLQKAGDPGRALEIFQHAVEAEPANSQAWQGLIQGHLEADDRPAAESGCRQCLAHNPGDPHCTELLAQLRMDAGAYREAAELFQAVLRNGKASKSILDGMAFSLMKLGDASQAARLFASSLQRYGRDPWIYANLGHICQLHGDFRAAAEHYRQAQRLSPNDADANHSLGFALYLAGEYAAAVEPLQAALQRRPDWGLAHFNLAMACWHLRQYATALTHARAAREYGVVEAGRIVQALSANLTLRQPRLVSVYRSKQ